jgi:hypothetical protein
MVKKIFIVLLLFAVATIIPSISYADQKLYWSSTGTPKGIFKSNLDGSNSQPIYLTTAPGDDEPQLLSIDEVQKKIYWTVNGQGKINRSNLDGTGLEVFQGSLLAQPISISIDPVNQKVYWVGSDGHLRRVNTDRTGVISNSAGYDEVAVAPPSDVILSNEGLKDIYSTQPISSFSAGSLYTILDNGDNHALTILHQPPIERVVYNDAISKIIKMRNVIGDAPISTLFSYGPLGFAPAYFAADHNESHLFFSDPNGGKIYRLLMDASGLPPPPPDIIFQEAGGRKPYGIATDCGTFATADTDGDGFIDCLENCPNDPLKQDPGICGCGISDTLAGSGCMQPTPTFTSTPTNTRTFTPTNTNTSSPTFTATRTFTPTNTNSPTLTPTQTLTPTNTATFTQTATPSQTMTPSQTFTVTNTASQTSTPTETAVPALTMTPTEVPTSAVPTNTPGIDPTPTPIEEEPEIRLLGLDTKLIFPPKIIVTGRTVRIILEKFSGFAVKGKITRAVIGNTASALKKGKITYRYKVNIKNKTAKTKDVLILNAKKNELSVKNLKPGNYNVNYQIEFVSDGSLVKHSNLSPSADFAIQ